MNAPARPEDEQEAMRAFGWKIDPNGDYVRRIGSDFYRVLAPYWDEYQPLCGRRADNLWTYEGPLGDEKTYFETPQTFAVWFAIEHSNN